MHCGISSVSGGHCWVDWRLAESPWGHGGFLTGHLTTATVFLHTDATAEGHAASQAEASLGLSIVPGTLLPQASCMPSAGAWGHFGLHKE